MKETLLRLAEISSGVIWSGEILLQETWIEGILTLHGCCEMSSLSVAARGVVWASLLVDPACD